MQLQICIFKVNDRKAYPVLSPPAELLSANIRVSRVH